jgi:hypothetical protein
MSEERDQMTFSIQADDFCLEVALLLRRLLDLDALPDQVEDDQPADTQPTDATEWEGER